jgi:osmotically-inducible protein OsmY
MKKFLIGFLLGVAVGVALLWYFQRAKTKSELDEARDRVTYAAWKAGKSIKEFVEEIKVELTRSGQVVREKSAAVGNTVSATAVTATVKGKLLTESGLRGVSVETAESVVTLTGSVASHEDIARAMKLALETVGVTKVVSKIQIAATR